LIESLSDSKIHTPPKVVDYSRKLSKGALERRQIRCFFVYRKQTLAGVNELVLGSTKLPHFFE
jgi:hypothetical protein